MSLPMLNLDDRTFDQLVDEAIRRIPVYGPEWTDHNIHDPGITFIELFAWLTEMQLYALNRIEDRNYLKFLKLLGIKLLPAGPAHVDVTFTSGKNINIERLTRVIAEDVLTKEKVVFETDEAIDVLPVKLEKVVSFANFKFTEVTEFSAPNQNFYYAFGEKVEVGSAVYFGFHFVKRIVVGKELKINICLYENDLPPRGQHGNEILRVYPSAEVSWEYLGSKGWSALELKSSVDEMVKTLSQSGSISFIIPQDIKEGQMPPAREELYWLRCQVVKAGFEIPPRIDRILLNTVSATQGITVKRREKEAVLGKGSGLPHQIFTARHVPIIVGSQLVKIQKENWQAVDDFDASNPESKHYVLDGEKGTITFGDGVQGKIPSADAVIKMSYRYGGGDMGNIGAGAILKADYRKDVDPAEISVTNHFPAVGGRRAETVREAITRARKEIKIPFRAVTSDDYEFIAGATPGIRVARAKAIVTSPNTVTVVVVPYSPLGKAVPSRGFMRTICEHLDMHRLITTNIKVEKPDYIQVSISATVKVRPGYSPESVRQRVESSLDRFLSPLKGGSEGKGWPLGRSVYRSEVYEVIEGVDGVDCVLKLSLAGAAGDRDIGALSLVYPGSHTIETVEPEAACGK
jgi:predicted phage baseplate assembly protein